jgi:Phage portal protein, lambda family
MPKPATNKVTFEKVLESKVSILIDRLLDSARDTLVDSAPSGHIVRDQMRMQISKEASNNTITAKIQDGEENFDGWLPLQGNIDRPYSFNLVQLQYIRRETRSMCIGNDIAQNVVKHYQNHIVGDGLLYELIKKDDGTDPKIAAQAKPEPIVKTLIANWEKFEVANNFNARLRNIVERGLRDGEVPIRFFAGDAGKAPKMRFVDPLFIDPGVADSKNTPYNQYEQTYGVKTAPEDIETIVGYWFNAALDQSQTGKSTLIPADKMVFIKRNTDYEFPRGIPDFWSILTQIRRIEKIVTNTSVLVQIQSAIALIRKHKNQTQARVERFVNGQSDGQDRSDTTTGRSITARKMRAGMIIDAPEGTEYDMPAAKISTKNFIDAAIQDMGKIAARFVLPLEWLLAKEPTAPLSPGSPVVKNFISEQGILYSYVADIFWRVQTMMGVPDVDTIREQYELIVSGPRLAVGKAIDEARVAQILQQTGSISPQTISAMFGVKYAVERANTIRHRNSLQDGEVAPGDLGNTNPGQNSGIASKKNGTKADNAPGGNQNQ